MLDRERPPRSRPSTRVAVQSHVGLASRARSAASFRAGARQAAQPTARKYVEPNRPWHDQVTINE